MSNITRWNPMRDMLSLQDSMDRLFDSLYHRPGGMSAFDNLNTPAMDLYQTDQSIIVKVSLPGVKAEDVHVSVAGDVFTIQGSMKQEEETKDAEYHIRERVSGDFTRSVALPAPVVVEKASAEFEDGILTLNLPKAAESRSKTITVKSK
ncbi:MAG: Hsp20/alpha crystallin family protein [Anaerolineaceae bacterium]